MRQHVRRLPAALAALALVGGALAVTAGPASATSPSLLAPQDVEGAGFNYGYEIDWDAPQTVAADPVTDYTASLYSGTTATGTALATIDVGPAEYSGDNSYGAGDFEADFDATTYQALTPGQPYVGAVVAHYADGDSVAVSGDADQAYLPVAKPTSVHVAPGNHKLTVTWKAPTTNSLTGTLYGYLVTLTPGPILDGATTPKVTVPNLKNGTKYTISIQPVAGDFGAVATATGTPIGTPGAPTHLKVAWKSGGKAKLTWTAAKSTTAAPVAGYVVYVNGKKVKTISGRTAHTWTVAHEKKGSKYTFSVRAENAAGTSKALSSKKLKRTVR